MEKNKPKFDEEKHVNDILCKLNDPTLSHFFMSEFGKIVDAYIIFQNE